MSQIILQPDGLFALWSDVVDDFTVTDATTEELMGYLRTIAMEDLEARMVRTAGRIEHVRAGNAREVYHQFAMTWAEAIEQRDANRDEKKEP